MIRKSMPSGSTRGWVPVFLGTNAKRLGRRSCSNKKLARLRLRPGKTAARADAALASNQNIENNPMQSSMAVAGIDALSEFCENILTRRANRGTIPSSRNLQNAHGPARQRAPLARLQAKSLPTIEVAPARRSCIGSPQRRVASRVAEPRALSDARARGDIDVNTVPDLDKATALVPGITNRYCSPRAAFPHRTFRHLDKSNSTYSYH